VRSRYKRQLIQLNMNKSGLHALEWKTRDPYSFVDDSLVTRTHCIADLQKMAVAEWLQSFNSVRGPMESLEIMRVPYTVSSCSSAH